MPEMPGVFDSGDGGLRAANARLRGLLAAREARIEEQAAENAALRELVTALQSQAADLAAQVKANSRNSSKPPSSDGPAKPSPKSQAFRRSYRLDVTPAESPRLRRWLALPPDPAIALHFDQVPYPDAPGRFWGAMRRDPPA